MGDTEVGEPGQSRVLETKGVEFFEWEQMGNCVKGSIKVWRW